MAATCPGVELHVTSCRARVNKRAEAQAVVIATKIGGTADGSPRRRGWRGSRLGSPGPGSLVIWPTASVRVELVIRDAEHLADAIVAVLQAAAWQACRPRVMRTAPAEVSEGNARIVAATICTSFAPLRPHQVRAQADLVVDMLAQQFPAVAELLRDVKADLPRPAVFPHLYWRKIWSTNPLPRLDREDKGRVDVGDLPDHGGVAATPPAPNVNYTDSSSRPDGPTPEQHLRNQSE